MKQFAFVLLALGLLAGCGSNEPKSTEHGTVAFALSGVNGYTLGASISLAALDIGDTDVLLHTQENQATLTAVLSVGTYTPELLNGWMLHGGGEPIPTEEVSFEGFDPPSVVVAPGATTNVALRFKVGDEAVILDFGAAAFLLEVEEDDCAPSCGAGTACVIVGTDEPDCLTTCANNNACGGGTCYGGYCVGSP